MLTPFFKRERIGLLPAALGAAKVISLYTQDDSDPAPVWPLKHAVSEESTFSLILSGIRHFMGFTISYTRGHNLRISRRLEIISGHLSFLNVHPDLARVGLLYCVSAKDAPPSAGCRAREFLWRSRDC